MPAARVNPRLWLSCLPLWAAAAAVGLVVAELLMQSARLGGRHSAEVGLDGCVHHDLYGRE